MLNEIRGRLPKPEKEAAQPCTAYGRSRFTSRASSVFKNDPKAERSERVLLNVYLLRTAVLKKPGVLLNLLSTRFAFLCSNLLADLLADLLG